MEHRVIPKPLGVIFKEAVLKPSSLSIILVFASLMLVITIVLMNYFLLKFTLFSDLFSLKEKIRIIVATFGSFRTNLSVVDQAITLITSLLAGVNIALLVDLLRRRASVQKIAGVNILGIVGSLLGTGCASCGSVILVSLLGLTAASGFLALLPLGGLEFGIISILLLLFSLGITIKKLRLPLVC